MHSSPYHGADQLHVGNGQGLNIPHVSNSKITLPHSSSRTLRLHDLPYVPSITKNLVSVSKLARDNCVFFEFHLFHCFVKSQDTKEVLLHGILGKDGSYQFNSFQLQHLPFTHTPGSAISKAFPPSLHFSVTSFPVSYSASCNKLNNEHRTFEVWHNRLGHASKHVVSYILHQHEIPFSNKTLVDVCKACCLGKAHRLPSHPSSTTYAFPLELIFTDL